MVNQVVADCDTDLWASGPTTGTAVLTGDALAVARAITARRDRPASTTPCAPSSPQAAAARRTPVLGITGTGGSGKS